MMRAGVIAVTIVVGFLLAGVLPVPGGGDRALFGRPAFIVATGVLCVLSAACVFRKRSLRRQVPFLLVHIGFAAVMAGGLAGFVSGTRGRLLVPLTRRHAVTRLPQPDGEAASLGFSISADRFEVDFYDPDYGLLRPVTGGSGYEFVARVSTGGGTVDAGPAGRVPVDSLRNAAGGWKPALAITNGWVLRRGRPTARHYGVDLHIIAADQSPTTMRIEVNHPGRHAGWRFYLQSYDERAGRYVILFVRRDPGRPVVIAGIWMLLVGTAWLCWVRGDGERR